MSLSVYYIILFLLGSIFGSFSTVLIERWYHKEGGILLGRSHCPKCGHILGAGELIPIFSFLIQNGKCKSCKTLIPYFYPAAEILMGIIFVMMGGVILQMGFFPIGTELLILLLFGFITGVYVLYDLRYMEIPDQIIIPGIFLCIIILLGSLIHPFFEGFLFDRSTYTTLSDLVRDHFLGAIILYSFFYLQILIPGGIFFIKQKRFHDLLELLLSYFIFPFSLLISHFRAEKSDETGESIPSWIGGGDLRIALFIGLSLGSLHGIASFFIAYIIGSIVGIIILMKKGGRKTEIPFGPFLGLGWIMALMLHGEIIDYINTLITI